MRFLISIIDSFPIHNYEDVIIDSKL